MISRPYLLEAELFDIRLLLGTLTTSAQKNGLTAAAYAREPHCRTPSSFAMRLVAGMTVCRVARLN